MICDRRFKSFTLASMVVLATVGGAVSAAAANRREAQRRETPPSDILQSSITGAPVMAVVSIRDQKISLYDAAGGMVRARVSSGQTGYETPVGIYSVLQKQKEHYSNLYDDASMPFMQRITWSGIALHAGVLPGRPASHGCVRLPYGYAQQIFPLTKMGMRVIVARDDVAPVVFSHARLPKPKPVEEIAVATPTAYETQGAGAEQASPLQPDVGRWPARQAQLEALKTAAKVKEAEASAAAAHADGLKRVVKKKQAERARVAKAVRIAEAAKRKADERLVRAEKSLAAAKSPSDIKDAEEANPKALAAVAEAEAKLAAATTQAQPAEDELKRATQELSVAEAARVAAVGVAQEAERKTFPVSVFVSLKTQRLYVRQGYAPVMDVPVAIADPEKPIGTHVYTAVDYVNQGRDARWTAVSIGGRQPDDPLNGGRTQRRTDADSLPQSTDPASASAALDRVTLPPEVATRMAEFVWPGTSLIVSDEGMSKETGKATDFVVLISGEPQGGIKKRKRQPPPDSYYGYGYYDDYYYDRRRPQQRYKSNQFFSFW